jgi:hypothetical protein
MVRSKFLGQENWIDYHPIQKQSHQMTNDMSSICSQNKVEADSGPYHNLVILYRLYSDEKNHHIVGYSVRHSDLRHACK